MWDLRILGVCFSYPCLLVVSCGSCLWRSEIFSGGFQVLVFCLFVCFDGFLWIVVILACVPLKGGKLRVPLLCYPESESHSVVSDSLRPHGLHSIWNSLGQNTGVGSRSLLQGMFPTQGLNPGLPRCRQILYQLSHQGNPCIILATQKKKKTFWFIFLIISYLFAYLFFNS